MNRIGLGLCVVGLTLTPLWGCGDDAKPHHPTQPVVGGSDNRAGEADMGGAENQPEVGGASASGATDGGATAGGVANGEAGHGGEGESVDPCQGVSTQGECVS